MNVNVNVTGHFSRCISRRIVMALAMGTMLLAACGSSTTVEPLVPTRIVVLGDGLSDVGQTGNLRYTVNDGSNNIWVQTVAGGYGSSVTAQSAGGLNRAVGNARISQKVTGVPSVAEQIDSFLAADKMGTKDVVMVSGGLSDLVALATAYKAGSISAADVLTNAEQAGKDLAAQARRLVAAGGQHVVVAGTYNLGKSPYAIALGETALLSQASTKFNTALLVNIVDLGSNVLFVDAEYYFNLLINAPNSYGLTTSNAAVCATVPITTAVPCTKATVVAGTDYTKYVFADDRYPTPAAHSLFGNYAYSKMKSRW